MGFLQRLPTVVAPSRRMPPRPFNYSQAFFSGDYLPEAWSASLSAAGINVTPELALTLSAYYGGVTMLSRDLATLPCQTFKRREDEGKDRVSGRSDARVGGITHLAYLLRWQPNLIQSAVEFFEAMVAQYVMRSRAYAEIVPGISGFLDQLLPRHPDRVQTERLPSGRLRYKLAEVDGSTRYLTQDEMFVVRDLSFDGGLTTLSRTAFGANAIGTALATQRAAGKSVVVRDTPPCQHGRRT